MSNSKGNMNIPGFSLHRQNHLLKEELTDSFLQLLDKGKFVLDENVSIFEKRIADYCGVRYGTGVANGSDALYLSLLACGIGRGDEVITTPFTFFATAGAIIRAGARPVFVDIDTETWNIDAELIEEKVTSRTRAILPVHLYGCPANMDKILQVSEKYELEVIEDAAQALGAKYRGKRVGSAGDLSCFSFFPTKNLGAFGDAGMVVTDNPDLAEKVSLLRVHGARKKYYHDLPGCNSRLDELQAAVLNVKFKYFEQWTKGRQNIARLYTNLFKKNFSPGSMPLKLPQEPKYDCHVYHQYTIQTNRRDELQKHLKNKGIGTTVYYPGPLHLQKVISSCGYGYSRGDFPVTEKACNEVLSLPMFPELTPEEAGRVVDSVVEFYRTCRL